MENQVVPEPTSTATPPLVTDSFTPIVPTNPKPSNHKPIIILIVILFLLSLSAITYLYFQNQALKQEANSLPLNNEELEGVETTSTDLISDLLTYTNPTHNVTFQYPADYTLTTSQDDLVVLSNGRIQINLKANVSASSVNNEIEAIQTAVANNDLTAQVRTLGERQAFIDSRMSAEGTFTTTAHIEHQNTQYLTLTLEADTTLPGNEEPAIYRELESLLDQILSTFQFLNSKDNTFNFSLLIPPSWTGHYRIEKEPDTAKYIFTGSTREYALFTLGKMSIKDWQAELAKNQPFTAQEIYSNPDLVVYVIRSLDNPLTGKDATQYQQMSSEITTILETFQLQP